MLQFDNNHISIEGNLNAKKGKRILKNSIIAGLIVLNLIMFSGCSKTIPCDVKESHAHYYVNEDYLGRYIFSEKSTVSGMDRSNNYIAVNQNDIELLKFINKKDLFRIDQNKKSIKEITSKHSDYKEYRYKYFYMMPMPRTHYNGKTTSITYYYIPMTGYSWTSNPNESRLTGEERICHYVYYGYKIIRNEKGKYEIEKSEPVDSLDLLPEGYDYIKEKFYDVVNLKDRDQVLDFEDGPEDGKNIITEEEYNQSEGKTR